MLAAKEAIQICTGDDEKKTNYACAFTVSSKSVKQLQLLLAITFSVLYFILFYLFIYFRYTRSLSSLSILDILRILNFLKESKLWKCK